MVNKKVQKSGKKDGEKESPSKKENKSNIPKEIGLKEMKKDMLKLIDTIDGLEIKVADISNKLKRIEHRIGMVV